MRIRSGGLVAVAIAVAVLAAGCGGGGGGGNRLTKEEYITQADAICKAANAKIDALGTPATLDEIAKLAEQATSIQQQALDDLRALKPPAEDEATLNKAYDLVEQQVTFGKQIEEAAKAGDQAKIQEIVAQVTPINQQADQIAKDYGLVECGNA